MDKCTKYALDIQTLYLESHQTLPSQTSFIVWTPLALS